MVSLNQLNPEASPAAASSGVLGLELAWRQMMPPPG